MKGRLIGLRLDGDYMKCEQDVTLNIDQEMIQISAGIFKDYVGGYKGWSIDVNGRFSVGTTQGNTNKVLQNFIDVDDYEYEVYLGSVEGASPEWYVKGKARLQNGSINANIEGNASSVYSFIGCGGLEDWAEEYWQIINAMPAPADKPIIVNTTGW